nr:unnamed protein product [Callosobruchus analis]
MCSPVVGKKAIRDACFPSPSRTSQSPAASLYANLETFRAQQEEINLSQFIRDIAGTTDIPKIFIEQICSKLDNYTEAVFMDVAEDNQKGGNDDRSSVQGPSSPTEY